MKVLVWKSYGDIKVYDVSTPEKLRGQIEDMIACVEDWGMESTVTLVQKHINKHPDDWKELKRSFNTLADAVGHSSHEMFEDIFITEVE